MHYLRIEDGYVVGEHFDLEKLTEEQRALFTPVEIVPKPETITGKTPVLKYNQETNTVFYEYIERPLTPEEEIDQLKQTVADLTEIVLNGGIV